MPKSFVVNGCARKYKLVKLHIHNSKCKIDYKPYGLNKFQETSSD